ncbi:MAG: 6-carboxytetrahydropterin synthase [Deltaproteobacteria bacterium]|nr:6-carboxytetrahydropterin synthase [Deltaproteobacteria bacterium]
MGRCYRMHGHDYRLEVVVEGTPDGRTGMVVDFHEVQDAIGPLVKAMDHASYNDVLENPTAEAIVVWIWQRVAPQLASLTELRLWETADCHVVYRGEPMPEELTAPGTGDAHPDTADPAG